jgi:hypothetical protein
MASTHAKISYTKSAIRLLGYVLLPINLVAAAAVLFVSEIIGIGEEVGH